jgi:endonuclease III
LLSHKGFDAMPWPRVAPAAQTLDRQRTTLARQVVDTFGGLVSRAFGIDVDAGDDEIERWFLATTLFGTRISATIVEQTFHELDQAGLVRVEQARHLLWEDLVDLLDMGGYVRYDFRTATRLQNLAERVHERYNGRVAAIAREANTYPALRDALDALPGWGPVTVGIFLRELRGVWSGADPPLDERATQAAGHLDLLTGSDPPVTQVARLACAAGIDARDLESGLVRLALAHAARMADCPGALRCTALAPRHGPGHSTLAPPHRRRTVMSWTPR